MNEELYYVNIYEHRNFSYDLLDLVVNFLFNNTSAFHFGVAQVYSCPRTWLATEILIVGFEH